MIVHDLDIGRSGRPFRPLKADSPLIVDTDAVLAPAIALQRLEAVSRKDREIFQRGRRVELVELQLGLPGKSGERLDVFAFGELARTLVPEAYDYGRSIPTALSLRQA